MQPYSPLLRADLGPTNTGKTHFALDRLLQYRTGIIGLPLRLFAREVYDRLVARVGASAVALVTGEERLIGAKTRYWVATAEAMPRDFAAEIVILDEIQLAADFERGYVFTDRMLNLRGSKETLFLGSQAMRPMMHSLFPKIKMETRPRLSKLSWAGRKKLTHLPPRSAVIAFSSEEVYAIAELLRREHGGAAVVMGALSPRTRNAQVELYQSGKVDFIVATDAIGLGLNLDIDYVFFAGTEKFDGQKHRSLFPHELAQIAGRAGRFSKDGGFGVTAGARLFSPETIDAIENHRFAPVRTVQWRNSKLSFATIDHLIASLEVAPTIDGLARTREADDLRALRHMSRSEPVRELTTHPQHVELLWQVCQLPDFPKFAAGEHLALVERIYRELRSTSGQISESYAESEIAKLAKTHHNVEILGRKLAQIRTWRYIAQRNGWLGRAEYWRNHTVQVEDALSDALHRALMARFVDERTSRLRRQLKEKEILMAEVSSEGKVSIDGNYVGELRGFQFELDPSAAGKEAKTIAQAASEALKPVYHLRTDKFYNAADKDITFNDNGTIFWQDAPIGALSKGSNAMNPEITTFTDENMPEEQREKVARRLGHWLERKRAELFAPLDAIQNDETIQGLARGIGFRIIENLGVLPRAEVAADVKNLSQEDRALLRKHGVRFGQFNLFVPALLKPAPTELRLLLSSLAKDEPQITPPPAGLVTIPKDESYQIYHYPQAGYHLAGERAIRVDMLERLADLLREQPREGFEAVPDMLSITGLSLEDLAKLLQNLGYSAQRGERPRARPTKEALQAAEAAGKEPEQEMEVFYIFKYVPKGNAAKPNRPKSKNKPNKDRPRHQAQTRAPRKEKPIDPDSPFAALAALKGGN